MTAGVWLNPGATLTIPKTFTMRSMRSKSPSSARKVARIDVAVTRAASRASSNVKLAPTFPLIMSEPAIGP